MGEPKKIFPRKQKTEERNEIPGALHPLSQGRDGELMDIGIMDAILVWREKSRLDHRERKACGSKYLSTSEDTAGARSFLRMFGERKGAWRSLFLEHSVIAMILGMNRWGGESRTPGP